MRADDDFADNGDGPDPADRWDDDDECGRWLNGRLGPWSDCRLAGTEQCDFECPYGRAGR